MSSSRDPTIVVGIDGTRESVRALQFAVVEAERTGAVLSLVNAVHEVVPVAPLWPFLLSETLVDVGRELLAEARTTVAELADGPVECRLVTASGPATQALVSAGQGAHLVVLGHRSAGVLERLFTGSTTFGVVARATCPVVSVPPDWVHDRRYDHLVAAVDGSESSAAVLACAFASAQDRSATLDVVHCWRLDPFYDYLVDEASVRQEWRAATRDRIHEMVDRLSLDHASVDAELRLDYDDVSDALVRRSYRTDVLFVGRHGHGGLAARAATANPGSTARAVIQHAHCPVEVVPVLPSPSIAGAAPPGMRVPGDATTA